MDMQRRTLFVGALLLVAMVVGCGCTQQDSGTVENGTSPTPTVVVQAEAGQVQPVPTPPGQWNGKDPEEVKFVDPSVYHITPTETTIALVTPPDDLHVDTTSMKDYATISSENVSGVMATEIYHIPFPYWELNYTVTGYNSDYAHFKMEIKDAEDPNREVGDITLGRSEFHAEDNSTEEENTSTGTLLLREEFGDYYFVIHPELIKSFSIKIRVPGKYLV